MKKKLLFLLIFAVAILASCTVTQYSGNLSQENHKVEFNKPNFMYVKTIEGSSYADYNGWGWDKTKVQGLVNEAKINMYSKHKLSPNQIITNVTNDILRSFNNRGFGTRKVTVVLSADVYEFYDGQPPKISNISESQDIVKEKIINSTARKKEIIKVNSNSPYFKYDKTPKVSDVVYFENYYTKKFEEGIVVGYVKGSSNVTLEFKNSKNKLKRKFISIDLLFQKK